MQIWSSFCLCDTFHSEAMKICGVLLKNCSCMAQNSIYSMLMGKTWYLTKCHEIFDILQDLSCSIQPWRRPSLTFSNDLLNEISINHNMTKNKEKSKIPIFFLESLFHIFFTNSYVSLLFWFSLPAFFWKFFDLRLKSSNALR